MKDVNSSYQRTVECPHLKNQTKKLTNLCFEMARYIDKIASSTDKHEKSLMFCIFYGFA